MRLESQDYSDQLKLTYTPQIYIYKKYKKEKKKILNMGYTIHPANDSAQR